MFLFLKKGNMICLGEAEYFRYNNPDEDNCTYLEEENNAIIHELTSSKNVKERFLNKPTKTKVCESLKNFKERKMGEFEARSNSKLFV